MQDLCADWGKGKERESTAGLARKEGCRPSEEAGQVAPEVFNEAKGTHEWQRRRPEFCEGTGKAAPLLSHVHDRFLHVKGQPEQSKYVRRHGIDPIINNVPGRSDSSINSLAIPDLFVLAFIRKSNLSDRKKQL